MAEKVLNKFLRYVKIDTQSDDSIDATPSTQKQFDLANLLVKELKEIGITDAHVDEFCYVYGTIPSNLKPEHSAFGKVPTIALLAHVDTSPDVSGANVKPQIIENYQGGDLVLPGNTAIVIREDENPKLKLSIGHTIVTTDGTTLLGADDKAGIAAIITAAEYIITHNEIIHGDIRVCFTPDEEIGMGTRKIDLKKLAAQYAYTVDGEYPGELNKETFSANAATITVHGRDIHPGSAKDIMVNSIRVMSDIIGMLPKYMSPETTDKYQPYIHPHHFEGSISKTTVKFLLRTFNTPELADQKIILEDIIKVAQIMNPKAKIELEIKEQYKNMGDYLDKDPIVTQCMWEAALKAGVTPFWEPIRGGTDGSRLTEMGLPCPNLYAGGQNFHSPNEWISINALEQTVQTIIELAQVWVEKYK